MNGDHTGPVFATAQGPPKPYPPPQLHGHTVIGLPGDLYVAVLPWIPDNPAERTLTLPAGGSRRYALIGPNVAIYPRTDPTPKREPRRAWPLWLRLLVAALGLVVAAPWLLVLAVYVRAFYGLYGQAVIRFFLP